jgi:tRNA threonylcarbamoyl adenosine modification protein YeaZ
LVVLLLGLDTATAAVTVALHDGSQPLAQLVTVDAHRHAELLAPVIAKVIADAGASRQDLTGVAVGVGPGPYTGLRVGVVTAKVLGAALGIPVYGVCSLDVIAADVEGERAFAVVTDARRREVYWASYDESGRLAGPEVDRPAEVLAQLNGQDLPVAGEGSLLYPEHFPYGRGPTYPAAATLCRIVATVLADPGVADPGVTGTGLAGTGLAGTGLAQTRPAWQPGVHPGPAWRPALLPAEPLYLRRPDAREPGVPKRVTP